MAETFEQWGISNLYVAPALDSGGYDTPHHMPYVVSIAVAPDDNTNNRDAADNKEVFNGSGSTVTLTVEATRFDDYYKENILGHISEGGGYGVGSTTRKHFAAIFDVDGNDKTERYVFYDCTSSEITRTHQTTDVDGNYTFAHETVTITARMAVLPNAQKRLYWSCFEGSTNFAGMHEAVYYPNGASGNAQLAALTLGTATLTPAFSPTVTEYAVTTTSSTINVTAVAADSSATIAIANGETTVTNGSTASLSSGENEITVTVTKGTSEKVYTVTVTKSA